MAWLTKSRFMAGRQCAKRLWFEVNEPLEAHAADSMPLRQGRAFDEFVRALWPGRVIARGRGMPARQTTSRSRPPGSRTGAATALASSARPSSW